MSFGLHQVTVLRPRLIAVLAAVLVSACGQKYSPAPVVHGTAGAPGAQESAALPSASAARVIQVRTGDSLYKIARRHNVRLRAIIDANRIPPPYTIFPGQKLKLPADGVHIVKRGDNIYDVARRYGVEPGAIVKANGLAPPFRLSPGQRLTLPSGQAQATRQTARSSSKAGNRRTVARTAPKSPPKSGPKTTRNAGNTAAASPPVAARPIPKPPPRSRSGFIWPLQGKVLSRFGPSGKGLHNDGINIRARRGAPVRAIDNGVVAYAGNEIRGFGNLLLIKHSGGWISAYAHNDRLLVRSGQRVQRGQVVSRVGSSGSVSTPQLHFELRRGKRAVDPERYLKRRASLDPDDARLYASFRPVRPARY